MTNFPEFPLKSYLKKLEMIRQRKLIGIYEISKLMKISPITYKSLINPNRITPIKAITLRTLKKFVDDNE